MNRSRYDVVILGGGPAGLATALMLRRTAEVSVLVAEAGAEGRERVGESAPPDLLLPLAELGLDERFRAGGHAPCPGSASLWGRMGYNDFIFNPLGPAWRLDRRRFDAMLAAAAREAGATVVFETCHLRTPSAVRSGGEDHELILARPNRAVIVVRAGWVVDATGPAARFARAMGVGRRVEDTLYALVRFAPLADGALSMQTLLEATRDGWWYVARLPDQRVIAMFVTDRQGLRRMRDGGAAEWTRALAATEFLGPRLGAAAAAFQDAPEIRLPVQSALLERADGHRWLAVGDAAASYDPIAAQGLYKALTDGIAAGRLLASRIGGGPAGGGDYSERIAQRFQEYSANRSYLYAMESRWPESPFWRARAQRAPSSVQRNRVVPESSQPRD